MYTQNTKRAGMRSRTCVLDCMIPMSGNSGEIDSECFHLLTNNFEMSGVGRIRVCATSPKNWRANIFQIRSHHIELPGGGL
jgi:hypothetical protein